MRANNIKKLAKYFDWWNGFLLVLVFVYFLGGSHISKMYFITSHASNFIISGFLSAGLMAYFAILFPPKNTKRFADVGYNVLHAKFRYVFAALFLFIILINIIIDVIGLDRFKLFATKIYQINTVDPVDAAAGIISVLITASIYYYAVWLQHKNSPLVK